MRHASGSGAQNGKKVGGPRIREAGTLPAVPALTVLLIGGALAAGCGAADPRAELDPKVQRYVAMWNTADFEGVEELLTEDLELLESPGFEPGVGIDNFKETVLAYHRFLPRFPYRGGRGHLREREGGGDLDDPRDEHRRGTAATHREKRRGDGDERDPLQGRQDQGRVDRGQGLRVVPAARLRDGTGGRHGKPIGREAAIRSHGPCRRRVPGRAPG